MGIREFVLERARQEGIKKGIEKGMSQKAYEMNVAFATSLISDTDFDDQKIAELVGVTAEFVMNLRKRDIS